MKKVVYMRMRITILVLISILISSYSASAYAVDAREKDLIYNETVSYNFSGISIGVIGENEYDVPLRIIENDNKVDIQNGTIYKRFDAWIGTYRFKKAIIRYSVNNSWIENNNISVIEIFRLNNADKKWSMLESKIINKDDNYTYLESETAYLSSFVIIGFSKDEKPDTITLSGEINEVEITEDDEDVNFTDVNKTKKSPGFGYGMILATILILVILMKNDKNK